MKRILVNTWIAICWVILTMIIGTVLQMVYQKWFDQPIKSVAIVPQDIAVGAQTSNSDNEEGDLPDAIRTPGVTNPDVTQDNIDQNICNPNWSTKSIRPPSSYTTKLKIQQIKEYGYSDTDPSHYEEDHLISLELGGHPTDPKNLWPEPYQIENGARIKDKVEGFLHRQVCAGKITLAEAQKEISTDWVIVKTK